jgi:hypothetical protein
VLVLVELVELVLLLLDEVEVLELEEVDDGGTALEPQNCTFEMSGVLP